MPQLFSDLPKPEISEDAKSAADEAIQRYGDKNDSELKTAAYLTAPMRFMLRREQSAKVNHYNAPIDFLAAHWCYALGRTNKLTPSPRPSPRLARRENDFVGRLTRGSRCAQPWAYFLPRWGKSVPPSPDFGARQLVGSREAAGAAPPTELNSR